MPNVIKYPDGSVKEIKPVVKKARNITKSRLGVNFEDAINDSNAYYLSKGIAAIYKKPTPVQIVKVDYPVRNKAKITEAYYKTPSTTDYNGIYREKYLDFEAKSCKEMNFSFERIYEHQVRHLETIHKMGGIAFLIIEFSSINEVYILKADLLTEKYNEGLHGERKSIPYEFFKAHGYLVERKLSPAIDYLKAVDKAFF